MKEWRRIGRVGPIAVLVGAVALTPHLVPAGAAQAGSADCSQWSADTSKNPRPFSLLLGVSAVSANDVWSVGWRAGSSPPVSTLIEHWDGARWSVVPSPNPGTAMNILMSVSAISSDDVWAVGYRLSDGISRTLIEHWDGSKWNGVRSKNPGQRDNDLMSVSAVSQNDVWAVGYQSHGGGAYNPLVERWDGTSWKVVAAPPREDEDVLLLGVGGTSSTDAWAVGDEGEGAPFHTYAIHWDGVAWSRVATPDPMPSNSLRGVAAIGPDDVWAAGAQSDDTTSKTLTLHWDGSTWDVVPSPSPGAELNAVRGLAFSAPGDLWALGYQSDGADLHTLIERWDGSSWAVVSSPDPGPENNLLLGVADWGGSYLWGVGYQSDGLAEQTLIESFSACLHTSPHFGARTSRFDRMALASPPSSTGPSTRNAPPHETGLPFLADVHGYVFDDDPVLVGQPLLYGATVGNTGPDPAVNARLVNWIKSGFQYVQSVPLDMGSCTFEEALSRLTCFFGTLDVDTHTTAHVVLFPTGPGDHVNRIRGRSDTEDPHPRNNGNFEDSLVIP
jgi:uncharacterized repeat protein (TIGR01451 family)